MDLEKDSDLKLNGNILEGAAKRGREEKVALLLLWLNYRDAKALEKAVSLSDVPKDLVDAVKIAKKLGLINVVNNRVFLSEDVVVGHTPEKLISLFRRRVIAAGILSGLLSILLILGIATVIIPSLEVPVILLIVILTLVVICSFLYIDYRRTLGYLPPP